MFIYSIFSLKKVLVYLLIKKNILKKNNLVSNDNLKRTVHKKEILKFHLQLKY